MNTNKKSFRFVKFVSIGVYSWLNFDRGVAALEFQWSRGPVVPRP